MSAVHLKRIEELTGRVRALESQVKRDAATIAKLRGELLAAEAELAAMTPTVETLAPAESEDDAG
jgi:hypothetical protein